MVTIWCRQCDAPSKYCCPGCFTYSCSLACVNAHKKELDCDGIRNKTAYVKMEEFTERDLLNDYRFLEEAGRVITNAFRDKKKHYSTAINYLPYHLHEFRHQARIRGTVLKVLPPHFTRRKINTSYCDIREKHITWRIDWIFPAANTTYTDRLSENVTMNAALEKYLDPDNSSEEIKQQLMLYQGAGYNGIKVLYYNESTKTYSELDTSETIKANLSGKTVIEFPLFHVILSISCSSYDIEEENE